MIQAGILANSLHAGNRISIDLYALMSLSNGLPKSHAQSSAKHGKVPPEFADENFQKCSSRCQHI